MTIEAVIQTAWIPLGSTDGLLDVSLDAICTLDSYREVAVKNKIVVDAFQENVRATWLEQSDLVDVLFTQGDS